MIPYGRQSIDEDDIAAVEGVLRSPLLTQGPKAEEFERALAQWCGARFAVVCNSGTSALHAAYAAAGLGPGDEFITTPLTFAATANAGLWLGAKPVFADVDPVTGNIDPARIDDVITPRTKVIAPVDYAGRPTDLERIRAIASARNLIVAEDASQALGASYQGKKIGNFSDMTIFSFHPVKSITTGEGGAVLTNHEPYYRFLKKFMTHGMTKTALLRPSPGPWYMEMQVLGQNYRMTDMQAALGLSQIGKLDRFIEARRARVARYNAAFAGVSTFSLPPADTAKTQSAWHLYAIRLRDDLIPRRAAIFETLQNAGIGVQVHHIPVHLHPYYEAMGYRHGDFPVTEKIYDCTISLPLYPDLTEADQSYVIETVKRIVV